MQERNIKSSSVICIVDDDEGLRDALHLLLTYEGWTVKTYPNAKAFLTSDMPSTPGCLILDYLMPETNGIDLLKIMKERGYHLPVIILTGHADVDIAVGSFRAGAVAFLKKPIDEELLLATLEEHLTEHFYKTRGLPSPKELHEVVDGFTDRERNVFELMLQNLTPTAIGVRLGLSNRTVYEYRSSIYRKLRTRDLSQLPLENFPAGFSGN